MKSDATVRFGLLKTLKRLDLSDADMREEMMVLWLDNAARCKECLKVDKKKWEDANPERVQELKLAAVP